MPPASSDNTDMNILDIFLGLILVAGLVLGLLRGFGKTALDALGLYAALWAAAALAPILAAHVKFQAGGAGLNESWALTLLFLVLGGLMLAASWYVNGMTQWDAGMFDKLLGVAAGGALGMILAHTLISTLVMGGAVSDGSQVASASLGTVSAELYDFPTYHSVMNTISGAGTYRRELPNVNGK